MVSVTAVLAAGVLRGVELKLYSDGGWSLDLSDPVLWRALFHCDNAYRLPAVEVEGPHELAAQPLPHGMVADQPS